MITFDDIVKEVAKNLDLDKDLVKAVCAIPFKHTVEIMKSDKTEDVLFNNLFKFKLKRRYKEDKQRQYSK